MTSAILLRRLRAEYQQIKKTFRKTRWIKVYPNKKDPPDEYLVIYKVNGIGLKDGNFIEVKKVICVIHLGYNYFDVGPTCTILSPHYHPNIYPNSSKFCAFSSAFRASEDMANYILRLGEVLQYKNYNLESPANIEAANWAKHNKKMFPLDKRDITEKRWYIYHIFWKKKDSYRKKYI